MVSTGDSPASSSLSTSAPLLVDVPTAAKLLSVSRAQAYVLLTSARVPGLLRVGERMKVSVRALEAWIQSQATS